MRFAGIDIGGESHYVAVVTEDGAVATEATRFAEDAGGYERVREVLGDPQDLLVAMEATGHYWHNLFAVLAAHGYQIALLNPLRTSRFAAEELARTTPDWIAKLVYDGRHRVGPELGKALFEAANVSVGQHHGQAFQLEIRYLCEAIRLLKRQLRELEGRIETTLGENEVGALLTTIEGIGPQTSARIIAAAGDPSRFRSAAAFAAYLGVVPALKHSGKHTPSRAGCSPLGHARLRKASGCRFSAPYGETRGSAPSTCVCGPLASCPRSLWLPPSESWPTPSTALPRTVRPSCRASARRAPRRHEKTATRSCST